jgi:hypothetical protein
VQLCGATEDLAEGLHYAALTTTHREWRSTVNSPGNGVVHLWLKCVESELRGYFFIDSRDYLHEDHLVEHPGWVASQPSTHLGGGKARDFAIAVNGSAVPLVEDFGGGSFLSKVVGAGGRGSVTVGVHGWSSWVDFPLALCSLRSVARLDDDPQLAIVAVAFSDNTRFHSKALPPAAVDAVLFHALYHRCSLAVSSYELVVRDAISEALEARLVNYPWITRLRPPSNPSHISVRGSVDVRGNYWQAIYYNLAVLRHSGDNVALALWDIDEFLVGADRAAFMGRVFSSDVLSISRRDVLCTNCTTPHGGRKPDMTGFPHSSYSAYPRNRRVPAEHFWQKSTIAPKALEPKVVLQPERVHNVYVHSAQPHTAVTELPPAEGELLHFYNLIRNRVDPRALDETWEQKFHLVQPVLLTGTCWQVTEGDRSYWGIPAAAGGSAPEPLDPGLRLRDALLGDAAAAAAAVAPARGSVLRHIAVDAFFLTAAAAAAVAYRVHTEAGAAEALKAGIYGAAVAALAGVRQTQAATVVAATALAGRLRARASSSTALAAFQARFEAMRSGGAV